MRCNVHDIYVTKSTCRMTHKYTKTWVLTCAIRYNI